MAEYIIKRFLGVFRYLMCVRAADSSKLVQGMQLRYLTMRITVHLFYDVNISE